MSLPSLVSIAILWLALSACHDVHTTNSNVKASVNRNYEWGRSPTIQVCLDNPDNVDQDKWSVLRQALQSEYNEKTPVTFIDFTACGPDTSRHIRVTVADERPRVADASAFGPGALGRQGAIVMNLSFQKYRAELCSGPDRVDTCIRSYAVHEFGHILGLMHEHERSDNTCPGFGDSFRNSGDFWSTTWGTVYDPESVMNYCMNASQLTFGKPVTLSQGDVDVLQRLYGTPPDLPSYMADLEPGLHGNDSYSGLRKLAAGKTHLAFAELRHQSDFRGAPSIVHRTLLAMMRTLIEEGTYSVVSFELPWRDMDAVNEYVQGRSAQMTTNLSAFHTPELLDFLGWLREYNKTAARKVDVTGFDIQHQSQQDFELIIGTMQREGLMDEASREQLTSVCRLNATEFNACSNELLRLKALLAKSPQPVDIEHDLLTLALESRLAEEVIKNIRTPEDFLRAFNARDRAMALAYTTLYKSRYAGRRVLSYGAFLHMAKHTETVATPWGFVTSVGSWLQKEYGLGYGVVGNLANLYTIETEIAQTLPDTSLSSSRLVMTLQSKDPHDPTTAVGTMTLTDRFLLWVDLQNHSRLPEALTRRQRFLAVPNVADIQWDTGALKDGELEKDTVAQFDTIRARLQEQFYEMVLPEQLDAVVFFYRDGKP